MHEKILDIVDHLHRSYREIGGINHISGPSLPSRSSIVAIMEDLESLIFPGYREEEPLHEKNLRHGIFEKIGRLSRHLTTEVQKSLIFKHRTGAGIPATATQYAGTSDEDNTPGKVETWEYAQQITCELLGKLPEIRRRLKMDVEAAFRGDPAGKSHEEVILAYPGVQAILIHRIAHELWIRDVPLIPRIMSEHVHGSTGIDIHPGAKIGDYFFIDHATGVVIGETTIIGKNVKIYQGVTIGALSVKKEEANKKRHPTIEDDVTIYAGATILGGNTVIGRGSIIGGNVWITSSVPAESTIYNKPSDYIMKQKNTGQPEFQI
jgi:serine O-acetyltransferase